MVEIRCHNLILNIDIRRTENGKDGIEWTNRIEISTTEYSFMLDEKVIEVIVVSYSDLIELQIINLDKKANKIIDM